jgi:hypothetical protein
MQDLSRRGRRWIVQQSYSLLVEFKQIFESFPRSTDARHGDMREQAYCAYNSGCVTVSGIGSIGTLNSRNAKGELW